MMKMKVSHFAVIGAVSVAMTAAAIADQISVPYQFTAGTTARASEVNENFQALADEINAQDLRISAIDGGAREQMVCTPAIYLSDRGIPLEINEKWPLPKVDLRALPGENTSLVDCFTPDGQELQGLSWQDVVSQGWGLALVWQVNSVPTFYFAR